MFSCPVGVLGSHLKAEYLSTKYLLSVAPLHAPLQFNLGDSTLISGFIITVWFELFE